MAFFSVLARDSLLIGVAKQHRHISHNNDNTFDLQEQRETLSVIRRTGSGTRIPKVQIESVEVRSPQEDDRGVDELLPVGGRRQHG